MKRFGAAVVLLSTLVGSEAFADEAGFYRTNPATNAFDYLLVAPPVFYDDWCWYVRERQKTHPSVRFAVKNTAAIYAEHPFGANLACRNAAESIHAYIRQAWTNGLKYVVLGGAWLDAQAEPSSAPNFATGETMSLSNCVPGVYGYPRENWRAIPADYFYACPALAAGETYPWDANGDGKYIDQADCPKNDLYPRLCVSRITLNPYNGGRTPYNPHALITNYVAKLARGENPRFRGHYRYGMSAASTGSSRLRKSGERMCYSELEFYDGMLNMFDPRHHDSLEDCEYSVRTRAVDQYSEWRPLREVKGMMNYTWTGGQPTLAAAMDDYYAADRDFAYVQAHGWAQGAAQFSAGRFATAKGLTLFNGGSGPCETGYPDYYVNRVLQYNVGDAAVTNPDGGALASVNNSRWSWAGGGGYGAMSYYMLNEMLIGFNKERLDVGHAWLKGCLNYYPVSHSGSTATWVLTEQFLYGDPLVRLPEVPDVWWRGGETGVWDNVTACWTNSVDETRAFDAANNVYFDIATNLTLDVAGEIAAMRLSLPVRGDGGVVSLTGTGSLRVAQAVDLAGTNATLRVGVAGGVGHKGIRFLAGPGDLVFEGTNKFYVGGVTNARRVALLGGGVTLDVETFPAGDFPLHIDGLDSAPLPLANELRSKTVGGLKRFGSLAISNSIVRLATVDAFGNDAPLTHALVDSELQIAANVYYQLSGYPEGLNATFLVDGDSAVTSGEGGLWTVKHTTTFALGPQASLALAAETVNAGGEIVITNRVADLIESNSVDVVNASALAGDVTVGAGLRLKLRELPLKAVTSLTVGEGATIELPDDASGYWQIVPVSSKFTCAKSATFVAESSPTNPLAGSPSPTGSFFREGALYRWTGEEGDWNVYFANRHPKILFGEIAKSTCVTVRVAAAVSPEFAFFSNLTTPYVFEAASDGASVLFSSVYFCGPTDFDVALAATEYIEISSATSRFAGVSAPYVHVASGAGLALAGSHWTDFVLDAGAVLVAMPGESLDWNAETSLSFPSDGEVLVDAGKLEPLGATPVPLIEGRGHVWTVADLKRLRLVQSDAEFRLVDGALCVAAGDGLKGPYTLALDASANWNTAAWMAASNALPRAWGACALDWSADATITATNSPSVTLGVDCDVHLNTLTVSAGTNAITLAADAPTRAFSVTTLDLTACDGAVDLALETGAADVLTSASTNGSAVVRLRGAGCGTIDLSGATLILDQPGAWSLTASAQGVIRVVAPQAYARFRVASVPDGFKASALTLIVTDAAGTELDGFAASVADGALWCVPPALQALVPPGTNDITRLDWRDVLGNVVSNVDWTSPTVAFELIGSETSGVVIAKSGFASVWSRLSVSNEVTLYGDETLSPSQIPRGNGVLALAGAFTLKADVNAAPNLLGGAKLKLLGGTTLELRHRSANYDARSQDWSGIVGTGRVVFADDAASWLALPSKIFANTLSVETASDLVLTEGYVGRAFALRNLAGAGRFRSDWANGNGARPVRTVQTGVSAFSGYLHHKDARYATLAVASDAPVPTLEKALILSGAAVEEHALTVETNGCVILTGSWQGPITVGGLLVITNACATNGLSVAVRAGGEVRVVTPDQLPALTPAPGYVAPTYPEDPEDPDEPGVEPEDRVTVVTAAVGDEAAVWSRLDWRDTNGACVAGLDWAAVTNATLTATNGHSRVIFDEETFTGVVRLNALTVEVRKRLPFSLAPESVGAVDFRLDPEPTVTCDLLTLAAQTAPDDPTNLLVAVHNRYGREIAAAGEVAFDATAGKYYLNVQAVNRPTYNCTFDISYEDSITSPLWFSGSGNLTYKARPEFFTPSRDGRALLGTSMDHFTMHSHNGNPTVAMDNINVWSLSFVVKLPTNNGGIIFGWGNKDSGNGVAFARVSENVAGVYAWQSGGGVRLVASARVPFASSQFHAYAITFDGETLSLYADGARAETASLVGKYPSRGFYQWFKMYGQNGGLSNGPSTVIDDFRLYVNTCLTPTSVRKIASDFPPWPENPTAEVDVADLAWSNLCWSAAQSDGEPCELVAGAGSLRLDEPVSVTNALAVSGGVVPIAFVGDGVLFVPGGLAVASSLEFDAAQLDGTNLAACAVANVPYSRWLLRGAFTGTVRVTGLPAVPDGYGVSVESDSSLGVRLVFTAPRYALAEALGVSVGPDTFADVTRELGLHPTSPTNWFAYAAWTNVATAVGPLAVVGSAGGHVDENEPYGAGASVARYFGHTSFDGNDDTYNGTTNGLTLTGLKARFGRYRALVYLATDTVGANFGPVTIAGRTYCGAVAGSESGRPTVADSPALAWGLSRVATATEGVNVVVSDVLDADEIAVSAQRLKNGETYARAQIAAVEIVKVGEIHAYTGSRYTADLAGDALWQNGEGANLTHHGAWTNGAFSSIAITAKVDKATLAFETAVTAETFRVVTAADQAVTLVKGAEMSVCEIDLSDNEGSVTLAGGLHLAGTDDGPVVLAAHARGALEIVVDSVAADQRLLKLASGFDCNATNFTATVREADGTLPGESWVVLPLDGWLVLQRRDIDAPQQSLTFESALTSVVPGSTPVALKGEGTPAYVAAGGGRKALTGATPYSNGQMLPVSTAWTIHAVAQMPNEVNGVLFGYGHKESRGVALATADASHVAVSWWNARGKYTVINATVTNATCQYHAYALVSTGTRLSLYVDGALKGSADVAVNPTTPVIQIGSIYGGTISGFAKSTTGALDDWRLYDGALSANAISTLATRFPPWPDYRLATLSAENTDWTDLIWQGEAGADHQLLVENCGGSLAVTNVCALTEALAATGNPLALRFTDEGLISAPALTLYAGWTIDCSALDATNLMVRADAASPYVHELVRGAYSGGDPTVTGLPELPDTYSLTVVKDSASGVSLVVSARADYVADLTNTTAWANGAGVGLDPMGDAWVSSASSTLLLTQRVDAATLTFDTSVTSAWLKVVSTNAQSLTLAAAPGVTLAPRLWDFASAQGEITVAGEGTLVTQGAWPTFRGLTNAAAWHGTLTIANLAGCKGQDFTGLGNATSTVELDGVSGWFGGTANYNTGTLTGKTHDYTLKIGPGGWAVNNGGSNLGSTFARLIGSGDLAFGGATPTIRLVIKDASAYQGRLSVLANAGVTIGTPTRKAPDGQLVVEADGTAAIAPSLPWSTRTGLVFDAGATLRLWADGSAERYTVTDGALTLPDTARLVFNDGENVRANWTARGGTLYKIEAWSTNRVVATSETHRAVRVTEPMTLTVSGLGSVSLDESLSATAKLTIDAGGVDATSLARLAVAGAPYSHWIVSGPVSGDIAVTNLPTVPATYAVEAEVVATHGVRLVVTANSAARFGAISVNLCKDASLEASDAVSGLYPVARRAWTNLTVGANASLTVSNVTFTLGDNVTSWQLNNAPPDDIYRQYMDDGDGRTSLISISGIAYDQYRVIAYYSTDTANSTFQPLVLNGVSYAAEPAGTTSARHTLRGLSAAWGHTGPDHQALAPAEGVNALVSDVLSGSQVTIKAVRPLGTTSRATLAALQIVKVGEIYEGPPEYEEKQLASNLQFVLPGTTITQAYTYVYHPLGETDDHSWATPANWATAQIWQRRSGAIETNYTAFTGSPSPALAKGAFVPVAFDGVTVTGATVEGWAANYGLYNGARVTINTLTKLQGGGTAKRIAVDATSRLTVVNDIAQNNSDGAVSLYVAAPSGIVWQTAFARSTGLTVNYTLDGEGSVVYLSGFSAGTHILLRASVELGDPREKGRTVRRKDLIIGRGTVNTTGTDVAGGVCRKTNDEALTGDDPIGTYRIVSDEKGVVLEWVAHGRADRLVVHPSETAELIPVDAMNAVRIVCAVTNATLESAVDLTDAFCLVETNGGVRATLNPSGRVTVQLTGAEPEEIAVKPELVAITGDDHVSRAPFALTERGAAVGIRTIPGLVYRLIRGETPAAVRSPAAPVAASARATDTRLKLEDPSRPAQAAFYLIQVVP